MTAHRSSILGVATMVVILIVTGVVARLAEAPLAATVRLTTAAGGGLVTPRDLIADDQRRIAFELVRLLLPGLLVQALLIKVAVDLRRGLTIPYLQVVAALGLFEVASLVAAAGVMKVFAATPSLGTLTPTEPLALFLATALTAASVIGEACVVQGLIQTRPDRLPLARRA